MELTQTFLTKCVYSCQNCDRDPDILHEKGSSLIYHITDQYDWNFCRHFHQCDHPLLVEDGPRKNERLTPDSPARAQVKNVILDTNIIAATKKLTMAVHTGGLESVYSLINKYSPERHSFSHKGMTVHTGFAVLDHNENLEREQATTPD